MVRLLMPALTVGAALYVAVQVVGVLRAWFQLAIILN
jgi:hypothetical protein